MQVCLAGCQANPQFSAAGLIAASWQHLSCTRRSGRQSIATWVRCCCRGIDCFGMEKLSADSAEKVCTFSTSASDCIRKRTANDILSLARCHWPEVLPRELEELKEVGRLANRNQAFSQRKNIACSRHVPDAKEKIVAKFGGRENSGAGALNREYSGYSETYEAALQTVFSTESFSNRFTSCICHV
jgi:hypothetical protein